jgi:hypothetical protein
VRPAPRADSGVPPESPGSSDSLGPAARNWDEVSERARIHFDVSKEEWAHRQSLHEKSETGTLKDQESDQKSLSETSSNPPPCSSRGDETQTSSPNLQSEICDLQLSVASYTVQRANEYWAWRKLAAALPDGQSPPPYTTAHRHCPCGKPNPCPDHESEPFGEYPTFFWSIPPHLQLYEICLAARNLPYHDPSECVPEQFRIYNNRD